MFDFNTLTFSQLGTVLEQGKQLAVICKKRVEDLEGYAECHMRAILSALTVQRHDDDVAAVTLDFEQFDDFNKKFESRNYFDKQGNPTLTAREKGEYEVREDYYVMATDLVAEFFTLLGEQQVQLMAEFSENATPRESYVAWLERTVLEQQAALKRFDTMF